MMSTPITQKAHALRFAYSTINWGTKPDLAATFQAVKRVGWQAVDSIVPVLALFRARKWPVLYPHAWPGATQ